MQMATGGMIRFPACMVFETWILWCVEQKVKCHESKPLSKQVFFIIFFYFLQMFKIL